MLQVEYDGRKQTRNEPDVAETTIAASNNFYVAKEEQVRYVDDLLPDFIYTFNISAKFVDGTFGPPNILRVETSPGTRAATDVARNLVSGGINIC